MDFTPASIGKDGKAEAAHTSADGNERHRLSTKQFGKQLNLLADETKLLKKLSLEVGKRGKVEGEDGRTVTRKGLTDLLNAHNRKLRSLKTNYTQQGRKKKRIGGKKTKGLSAGVFIDQPLKDFFMKADYGPKTKEVRATIKPLLEQNMLSRAIVTPLLTMWYKQNSYKVPETNAKGKAVEKTYIKADATMKKFLGPYLKETGIDKDKFVYAKLQTIVNPGIFKKAQLDEEYIEAAKAAQPELDDVQAKISLLNKQTA